MTAGSADGRDEQPSGSRSGGAGEAGIPRPRSDEAGGGSAARVTGAPAAPLPRGAGAEAGARRVWSLIVPVKPTAVGKSRLSVPGVDRAALARAIALDTLEAAARAASVAELVVVTDDTGVRDALRDGPAAAPDEQVARVTLVADPGRGLNAAIAAGLGATAAPFRAAMLGDLPALRPADLDAALALAWSPRATARTGNGENSTAGSGNGENGGGPGNNAGDAGSRNGDNGTAKPGNGAGDADPGLTDPLAVADADGTGTTLLAHAHPELLRFGADSYARHLAAGALPLDVPAESTLRRDVDTAPHLADALALGLGPRTSALLA